MRNGRSCTGSHARSGDPTPKSVVSVYVEKYWDIQDRTKSYFIANLIHAVIGAG